MADELTPRERREARARRRRVRFDPGVLRKLAVPLIAFSVLGLVVFMVVKRETEDATCPGHWHTNFHIVVNGERVTFDQPPYTLGEGGIMPSRMHMHRPNDYTLHMEPSTPTCESLREILSVVGVELRSDRLEIEKGHSVEGTFRDNSTNALRAWVGIPGEEPGSVTWEERAWSSFARMGQPKDGMRLLIVSGEASAEEVAQYQAAVPTVSGF